MAVYVCVCCEGLDSRQSCRLSAKSRNNQQPRQEGSSIPGFALRSSYRCRFTQASQQKQTSLDILCIFTQTNSPEALKASHVWPRKHTRTHIFIFLLFVFPPYVSYKDEQRHRRRRAQAREETRRHTHSHSLHQNPLWESVHVESLAERSPIIASLY